MPIVNFNPFRQLPLGRKVAGCSRHAVVMNAAEASCSWLRPEGAIIPRIMGPVKATVMEGVKSYFHDAESLIRLPLQPFFLSYSS